MYVDSPPGTRPAPRGIAAGGQMAVRLLRYGVATRGVKGVHCTDPGGQMAVRLVRYRVATEEVAAAR